MIHSAFLPFRGPRYVGGDFYHFEKMDQDRMVGVLADVSGKA
jgi:serine phosphatase RsbU (regulator of sigma subunit)